MASRNSDRIAITSSLSSFFFLGDSASHALIVFALMRQAITFLISHFYRDQKGINTNICFSLVLYGSFALCQGVVANS